MPCCRLASCRRPETDKAATPAAAALRAAETKADAAAAKEAAPAAKVPAKKVKQLSPEMTERRDQVRRLLAALRTQPFNTQQNTCTDVLDFCRAFGCETELTDNATSGQKVNGITCLCWNMPCGGYELMTISEGHLAPRVGYGYQNNSSELAAVLALAQVPADYPARAGKTVRTVADLIEYEKLTCRPGLDMSLKLVALANYVQEPSWKDSLGGEWTLQRVVAEELNRPQGTRPHAATNRLLGLCAALERFKNDKVPLGRRPGPGEALHRRIDRLRLCVAEHRRQLGPADQPRLCHGRRLHRAHARVARHDLARQPAGRAVKSCGRIDFLHNTFNSPHYQTYISTMSAREISAAMHAAYVLNAYDQRVFVPRRSAAGRRTGQDGKARAEVGQPRGPVAIDLAPSCRSSP